MPTSLDVYAPSQQGPWPVVIAVQFILLIAVMLIIPIVAIVCGSFDIKRIKAGLYSKKGKGMDITGITSGSIYLIAVISLLIWTF